MSGLLIAVPESSSPEMAGKLRSAVSNAISAGKLVEARQTVDEFSKRFPDFPPFLREKVRVYRASRDFNSYCESLAALASIPNGAISKVERRYVEAHQSCVANIDGVTLSIGPEWDAVLSDEMRFALVSGRYEQAERDAVSSLLESGDTVLECGAGSGLMGILVNKTFPGIGYLSVEANPDLLPWISVNKQINGIDFEVLNAAVGFGSEPVKFCRSDNFAASQTFGLENDAASSAVNAIEIEQMPLDTLLKYSKANVVLIDIEGAEYSSLMNADLNDVDKIVVEMHPTILGDIKVTELIYHLIQKGFVIKVGASSGDVLSFVR